MKTAVWPNQVVTGGKLPQHSDQMARVRTMMWSRNSRRKVPASLSAIALAAAPDGSPDPTHAERGEPGIEVLAERAGDPSLITSRASRSGSCLANRLTFALHRASPAGRAQAPNC